jgi:hypothetical protein
MLFLPLVSSILDLFISGTSTCYGPAIIIGIGAIFQGKRKVVCVLEQSKYDRKQ